MQPIKIVLLLMLTLCLAFVEHFAIASADNKATGNYRVMRVVVMTTKQHQVLHTSSQLVWDKQGRQSRLLVEQQLGGALPDLSIIFDFIYTDNHRLIKRIVQSQGGAGKKNSNKQFFYGKVLEKTEELIISDDFPENKAKIIRQFSYDKQGKVIAMTSQFFINNVLNTTEEHRLRYNRKGEVVENRITRQASQGPALEEIHLHEYDSSGYLQKTVISTPHIKTVKTYLPFDGDIQIIKIVTTDIKTNTTISQSTIQSIYEKGLCLLTQPTDARNIESAFDGTPYSDNMGCIYRH